MSVNKYQPHVLVLPEDDTNGDVANGFLLDRSVSLWKTDTIWGHELLKHNASELERLCEQVRPILFPIIGEPSN